MARKTLTPLGALRHRITLLAVQETPNDLGGASISYSPIRTLWGRIEASSGIENLEGEALAARIQTRITLRWRDDLDASLRLQSGARLFAVRAVFDPDGTRQFLVCQCEEIAP
jgi:SPP1 family predicted phage head-tail adaptor